ncbi:hypothetical protein HA402_011837 [Bradysia odoriphaga]|nr:hypothetical protein HA402_011837 [Bradysia odoriphaga]
MAGDGKIVPIIEEELESGKVSDKPNENSVADNGSSIRNNGSSMNSSENANHTPPITLVRQTSTPMTKMLHEVKRNSYESMSASSIQMSSIENCSSENDISPPVPSATSNLILFKQPNRRMPVGATPYRQIMSKSIQRAFSNQGISRVNATPPLDLRTSPVIRRTASMEGNVKPRAVGMRNDANTVDLRTTPVIRRTRHFEAKNLAKAINARPDGLYGTFIESEENPPGNPKVSLLISPPKSSLSRSKSTNTFFETCRSFDASVTSSDQISETPKSTGLSKRSSSFSSRHKIKKTSDGEKWFTPSPENAENIPAGSTKVLNDGSSNKNELKHERSETTKRDDDKDKDLNNQPSKGIIWSLVTSVLRFTSSGGGAATSNLVSDDKNSLIKRCASFTGILPKKPNLPNMTDENPYKRRRTTTLSEVESFSQLGDDGDISAKRMQRINARPPINRMRQS